MAAYEACYLFKPDDLPTKNDTSRRSIQPEDCNQSTGFVPLLCGKESPLSIEHRAGLFHQTWSSQQESFNSIINHLNSGAINDVVQFIKAANTCDANGKIPTGFVVAGPATTTHMGLFDAIAEKIKSEENTIAVTLDSTQIFNLKSMLKHINQYATNRTPDVADEETFVTTRKGPRYLNYDLHILNDYVQEGSLSRVVLLFQDSEAFEGNLLDDLVDVLSSWNDRIPFVLIFGIATSLEIFQDKLSRATLRRLQGERFDVSHVDVEEVFQAATAFDKSRTVFLGANLYDAILQHQKNNIQDVSIFTRAIKYAYMTYFFANPLSIFSGRSNSAPGIQREHYEALRNLTSFQSFAEKTLENGDYETTRSLLEEDAFLQDNLSHYINESYERIQCILQALKLISLAQSLISPNNITTWSTLYTGGMSGKLKDSILVRDLLDSIKKLPPHIMRDLLTSLSAYPVPDVPSILLDLDNLLAAREPNTSPLRSEHDINHRTLRTTVIAQKVSLSRQKPALSSQNLAYSELVGRFSTQLAQFLHTNLIDPRTLFLHEILIYDLKSPHRDVFTPRPRFAIERALSMPHDYLGCNCCKGLDSALSPSQPPTAILYQLYLECGAIINGADLWAAFHAVVGNEGSENEEADRDRTLALFTRALAELKYMGMIKNSRKKVDHLSKLLWKGL